jgi:hypothetical protein
MLVDPKLGLDPVKKSDYALAIAPSETHVLPGL